MKREFPYIKSKSEVTVHNLQDKIDSFDDSLISFAKKFEPKRGSRIGLEQPRLRKFKIAKHSPDMGVYDIHLTKFEKKRVKVEDPYEVVALKVKFKKHSELNKNLGVSDKNIPDAINDNYYQFQLEGKTPKDIRDDIWLKEAGSETKFTALVHNAETKDDMNQFFEEYHKRRAKRGKKAETPPLDADSSMAESKTSESKLSESKLSAESNLSAEPKTPSPSKIHAQSLSSLSPILEQSRESKPFFDTFAFWDDEEPPPLEPLEPERKRTGEEDEDEEEEKESHEADLEKGYVYIQIKARARKLEKSLAKLKESGTEAPLKEKIQIYRDALQITRDIKKYFAEAGKYDKRVREAAVTAVKGIKTLSPDFDQKLAKLKIDISKKFRETTARTLVRTILYDTRKPDVLVEAKDDAGDY
jgi:hypothetical protein